MDQVAAPPPPTSVVDQNITLAEYLGVLRRARWLIAGFVAACAALALLAGILQPTRYTAVIVVAPVSSSSSGSQLSGLSSLVSSVSSIASLTGISVGEDSKRAQTLAVLQSSALTERYIAANNLLPVLYPKLWDPAAKRWKTNDPTKVPTLWKADRLFAKKIRIITLDPKTGLVTMDIVWKNPQQAAAWANGLVEMTNEYLRTEAIDESQRNIDYLDDQAVKTTLVPVKEVIYGILENEFSKEMLARGTKEYALKVLDPAQPPELPSSLKPMSWMLIGLVTGIGTSLFLAFFRLAWSRSD
jgi:uncharacterized protein involved in exopolysaccharide biosynthesis